MSDAGFSENAITVLRQRYLWRDTEGKIVETPEELLLRVASAIASVETPDSRAGWADRFFNLMSTKNFLPNSPTLMNAGRPGGQLSACFVLPIEDALESIFDTLKFAAKIHQSGGGTGFSFSRIRPEGSRVQTTAGVASGPVSFIRVFDSATEAIKQGGARRGANMAVLRADHPDIFKFVESKRDQAAFHNFNISVGATAEFMQAVEQKGSFWLRDPKTGQGIKQVAAAELFDLIARAAWECGDPGLIFLDRINLLNPTPLEGPMESTNPCGEQPLLAFESCNLGSLNLGNYYESGGFAWDKFSADVRDSVRFLDNVVDLNSYPLKECEQITKRNRKIGLGVMGFADLLLMMGISYDSNAAVEWGERIMGFLDRTAKQASVALAQERGAFPGFQGSLWERLGYPPMRNATVTTVAPTGTISMLAGASSGIEPIFAGIFFRNVLSGKRLIEVHPAVRRVFQEKGIPLDGLTEDDIAQTLGSAWTAAREVSVRGHVRMQAVFQRFSDSAVSKTINLPNFATEVNVREAYLLAYREGCKGITVYRDKSRRSQVLETS